MKTACSIYWPHLFTDFNLDFPEENIINIILSTLIGEKNQTDSKGKVYNLNYLSFITIMKESIICM